MTAVRRFVPVLSAALTIALGFGLLSSYRSIQGALKARQTEMLQANHRVLARECAAAWGPRFERVCLEGMYFTAQLSEPSAFFSSLVADDELRIVLHSDFLKNDFQRRGGVVSDIVLGKSVSGGSSFNLSREGQLVIGEPLISKGKKVGMLVAIYNEDALDRRLAEILAPIQRRLAYGGLLGLCLAVLFAAALGYFFLIPVSRV